MFLAINKDYNVGNQRVYSISLLIISIEIGGRTLPTLPSESKVKELG